MFVTLRCCPSLVQYVILRYRFAVHMYIISKNRKPTLECAKSLLLEGPLGVVLEVGVVQQEGHIVVILGLAACFAPGRGGLWLSTPLSLSLHCAEHTLRLLSSGRR